MIVGDGGWVVMITQSRPSTGVYNGTLQVGVILLWGSYVIDQCPVGRDPYLCKKSILTPHNPKEKVSFTILQETVFKHMQSFVFNLMFCITHEDIVFQIFIQYYTDRYVAGELPPTSYLFLDLVIENKYWGNGRSIGLSPKRHDTQNREGFEMVSAGRNVLTWAAYAPYMGV